MCIFCAQGHKLYGCKMAFCSRMKFSKTCDISHYKFHTKWWNSTSKINKNCFAKVSWVRYSSRTLFFPHFKLKICQIESHSCLKIVCVPSEISKNLWENLSWAHWQCMFIRTFMCIYSPATICPREYAKNTPSWLNVTM